jgi:rRNA maturation RNase YbeY
MTQTAEFMEPPSSGKVTILNESGFNLPADSLQVAVATAFAIHGVPEAEACVLLCTDEHILELNRQFRGISEATDVLTFPSGERSNLGDIAISAPYAMRQAEARGCSLEEELSFLAIHGALHLVGFDDQTERERAEMVDEMNQVAHRIGLKQDLEWASLLHEEAV